MFRRAGRPRPLRIGNLDAAVRLAATAPLVNALAGSRLLELSRSAPSLADEFCFTGPEDAPDALLWEGANVSPLQAGREDLDHFADHLRSRRRRAGSLVGPRDAIELLWSRIGPTWGPARELRWSQPLLEATDPPAVAPEPRLRAARRGEEQIVMPAGVAMFREEVGYDPTLHDGGRGYLRRITELIAAGRTYVIVEDGRVVFKADVGAVFGPVAQVHGVWVAPDLRGEGIARRAMVSLVQQVRAAHAPRVSLYVNDYNEPARRAYAASGFRPRAELATVLF